MLLKYSSCRNQHLFAFVPYFFLQKAIEKMCCSCNPVSGFVILKYARDGYQY